MSDLITIDRLHAPFALVKQVHAGLLNLAMPKMTFFPVKRFAMAGNRSLLSIFSILWTPSSPRRRGSHDA
jgi:hypothetical protein